MARLPGPPTSEQGLAAVLAELHALRERVQMQHALLDVYAHARAGGAAAARTIELWEDLPGRVRADQVAATGDEGEVERAETPPDVATAAPSPPPPLPPPLPPPGAAWWPVDAPAPAPLVPHAGWALYATAAHVTSVIGFSVCGLAPAELEQAVDLIASVQREKRNFVPLFLTDRDDLEIFRRHGFVVEYLPAVPPPGTSDEAWRAYGGERRAFVTRKWNLSRIVEFGPATFGGGPTAVPETAAPAPPLALAEPAPVATPSRSGPDRPVAAARVRKKAPPAPRPKPKTRKPGRPATGRRRPPLK
jgi:hypothetical protein